MSHETIDTSVSIIRIDPFKSFPALIHLIHRLMTLIQMKQRFYPLFHLLMLRLSQQEPVKFSFLAPFTKLSEFLPHEKKLLTGVSHHECITSFKVSIFIKSQSRHLIKHRTLKMYHFIMRQYQDIILTVCITHGKCHQMMIILTEIWIQLHIFREIVHPSHIPLQAET